MGNLSAFMSQNAVKIDNLKKPVSKRFVDETGKPIEWEICAITSEEDEQIRKDCTKRIPVPGSRGQFTRETDYTSYVGKLAARCTVFPNLNDAELQNSYGVMGAENLLKKMLIGGEYAEYLLTVQGHNGFDVPLGELVEEAKN